MPDILSSQVVGAGAVVTKDVGTRETVFGIPARVVKPASNKLREPKAALSVGTVN